MSRLPVTVPAFEAIAYQGQSMLFQELTAIFQKFLNDRQFSQSAMANLKLETVIEKYTGLSTKVKYVNSSVMNASAQLHPIHVNNPLERKVQDMFRVLTDAYGQAEVREWHQNELHDLGFLSRSVDIVIDRKNGMLKGLRGVIHELRLYGGLFKGKLTASEIAAVTLHEIGHVFNYYEWLLKTASTNVVLDAAWKAYSKANDAEVKLRIIDYTSKCLELDEAHQPKGTELRSKDQFFTLYLTSVLPTIRANLGNVAYDVRNSEQAADQFAARHGAARDLTTALAKMDGPFALHRYSKLTFVLVSAVNAAIALLVSLSWPLVGVAIVIVLLATLASSDFNHEDYDTPKQRNAKLMGEIVSALKNDGIDPNERAKLLNDYEVLKELDSKIQEHTGLFSLVWRNLTSYRRNQHSLMKFQQELEQLTNNELYVKAQSFNALLA